MNWHSNKRQLTHVYGLVPLRKSQPVSERVHTRSIFKKNCYSTHSTMIPTKSLNKILHEKVVVQTGDFLG